MNTTNNNMEPLQAMNDLEIQEKVESLAGKGTRVVDCEKSTSFQTEEVLLVNGFPVPLAGEEGRRIKEALLSGQVPPGDLLNEILIRAGILKNPVELEATVNVKSTTKTTEVMTLRDKNGLLLDERMKEVEEDNEFSSTSKEVWKKDGRAGIAGIGLARKVPNNTTTGLLGVSSDNLEDHFTKINLLNGGDSSSSVSSTPKSSFKFGGGQSTSASSSCSPSGSRDNVPLVQQQQPPPLPHLHLSNHHHHHNSSSISNIGGAMGISHSPQSSSSSSGISEGSSSVRSESSASSRFSVSALSLLYYEPARI